MWNLLQAMLSLLQSVVFNELNRLHLCGVKTWVAEKYAIDIASSNQNFKKHCKLVISDWHKRNWSTEVTNIHKHPS